MKKAIIFATLLMVGCGGNQSENKNTEESVAKKVSAQMADGKKLPELKVVMPQSAPRIDAITANKDAEYVKSRHIPIEIKEE
ncbi:MAG: hypothetical protein J6U73_06465 [Alistipes sp.]|nr:hypothetical protein [Alistipes sp.]